MNAFSIGQSLQSWYGGTIMVLLCLLSVYLVALIIMRFNFFKRIALMSRPAQEAVEQAVRESDADLLEKFKGHRAGDAPVRVLIGTALQNSKMSAQDLSEVLWMARVRQKGRLTRGLGRFGTFAAIAPFLGLLGTVLGIVDSFNSLALSGEAGPNVVGSGVASALWTTAAGLVVAIPAVIAFNVFNHKAKAVMEELEITGRQMLLVLRKGRS